ncbi:MAG: hypothetical protein ACNA71_00970 [Kiritimatiellia bacterium]
MKRSGSILILALWVLFFLAALTVAAAGHVWAVLQAAERLQTSVQSRLQASSMAAWAAAVIEDHVGMQDADGGTNRWDGVADNAWNRDPVLFRLPFDHHRDDGELEARLYFTLPDDDTVFGGVIGEQGRLHLNEGHPFWLRSLFGYVGGETGAQVARSLFGAGVAGDGELTGSEQTE